MIKYDKMLAVFDEKNITSYTMKKNKIIGQASWKKIHEGGTIDTKTLNAICNLLHMQPGDLLEWVEDPAE